MFDTRDDRAPWLGVTASFALGALATWLVYVAAQRMRMPGPVSDDIVLERVRSRIAQVVSEPGDVDVTVEHGVVRLSGTVPAEERDELLIQLVYLPGVVRLRNALAAGS
ncbi:MAG TPA: BON domain-containing protein [Ramlibacter sp.]